MDKSVSDKGTELEKNQVEAEVNDQVFSDAFDVAEKITDDNVSSALKQDAEHDTSADQDAKNVDDKQGSAVADEKKADSADDSKTATNTSAQKATEDFEQKWRSLNGILKSNNEKYESERTELLGKISSLEKTISELNGKVDNKKGKDAKDSKSIFDDLDDATKVALEEYEKDFDSVSKMEGIKREKALAKLKAEILDEIGGKTKEILEQLTTRTAPIEKIEKTIEENDRNAHFSAIREAHSDFETYRDNGSILKWIETKPKYIQDAMKATYAEGEAGDVVDLISDFKKENGLLKENNESASSDAIAEANKRKAEKKQNLTAVVTKHTSVNTSHAPASGYEEAFDEAASRA